MSDPLSKLKNRESGADLYLTIKEGSPAKVRVVSTDPYIHKDKYGNTRFAFAVWSHDLSRPMILDKGWGIAKNIQALHMDDDYGADITNVDIKITATGSGLETRYSINVLPKTLKLEDGHFEEAQSLNLDKIIKNGLYASDYNKGKELPATDINADMPGLDPDAADRFVDSLKDEPWVDQK